MRNGLKRFIAGVAAAAISVSIFASISFAISAEETDLTTNILDYSSLNTVSLGETGYIDVDDDGFVVNLDGSKSSISFFGVDYSLSSNGLPTTDEQLSQMLGELSRHGVNLIRLQDCYSYFMLSANELDENKMVLFDRFLAALRDHGMYVELDMFTQASLGANGIAMLIDDTVIARAERFFKRFLDRVNTVNGQYYATDTVIAFIKYVSDSSIGWISSGDDVSAYSATLQPLFNKWLLEKYEDRASLYTAWKNADGSAVLGADEDPEKGTVAIGSFAVGGELTVPQDTTGYIRTADFYAFLCEYAQTKFDELVAYCRSLGYRSPVICSDTSIGPISTELSALGGVSAKNITYTSDMTVQTAMQQAVTGAVSGMPYIVSWDLSADLPAKTDLFTKLVSYSSMQGFDAFIVGDYSLNDTAGVYNVKNDTNIWPQSGLMATIFRYHFVKEAQNQVEVVYDRYGKMMEKGMFGSAGSPAALISKVGFSYMDTEYDGNGDIVIASGNSASGIYEEAKTAIIQSYENFTSPAFYDTKKESWYNRQGLLSAIDSFDIEGKEVYIGEGKAILPTGMIESVSEYTSVLRTLGVFDDTMGAVGDTIVSDTNQVTYNLQTDSMVVDGNRVSIFSGDLSGDLSTENISISGFSGRGTIVVYGLGEGVSSETASEFQIYAVDENGNPGLTGEVRIKRADSTISAYKVGADGIVTSDALESNSDDAADLLTIRLDGSNAYYMARIADVDLDASLEGYDIEAPFPDRSMIMVIIFVPGIIILVIAYLILLYMDNRKVKHEAALRKATLEKKMKQRSVHVQTFQRAVEKEDTTNTVLLNSGKRAKYEVYDPQEEENVDPKWRFNVEWTPAPEQRVIRITKEQEEQVLAHNKQLEKETAEKENAEKATASAESADSNSKLNSKNDSEKQDKKKKK